MFPQIHIAMFAIVLSLAASVLPSFAQTVTAGARTFAPYTPLVWDIDWSYLSDQKNRRDWTDSLHYLQVGQSPSHFVSLTGQIRERGEYQDHPAWGAQPPDNGYRLQRYLLSQDLHLGVFDHQGRRPGRLFATILLLRHTLRIETAGNP